MVRLPLFLLLSLSLCVVSAAPSIPHKWRSHRISRQAPVRVMTHHDQPSLSLPTSCPIHSNATILHNVACINNTNVWYRLITHWKELSSLKQLINTTNVTLFVPTNNAIQNGLSVLMRTFRVKIGIGNATGPIDIPQTEPPSETLIKQLPKAMDTMEMEERKETSPLPPPTLYYNLSYPFPPPILTMNVSLTEQQMISIVERLPKSLRTLFASTLAYHVIPHHVITRNTTCFMNAYETAMEGKEVEQVTGGQRLLLQYWRNGMNATEYQTYLRTRHNIVQGPFQPSLPQQDLRILTGDHSTRFNVDPIAVDIISSNGVIHIVDKMIMIPPSVFGYLALMGNTTSYISSALHQHGHSLLQWLQRENTTIFIPSNYAFTRNGISPYTIRQEQWVQLLRSHVAEKVNVWIPDIGNTSFCNVTHTPLNITSLSKTPLIINYHPEWNYSYYINRIRMVDDNVIVSNGVIHLVDNLLISPQLMNELRSIPTPSCPPNTDICFIHNITTQQHMLQYHTTQRIPVCFNRTTHVCINGTYICPIHMPLLCKGATSLHCYNASEYVCATQPNGTSILIPITALPMPQPPITPYPGPSPVATPPPTPIIPPIQRIPTSTPIPTEPTPTPTPTPAPQPLPQPAPMPGTTPAPTPGAGATPSPLPPPTGA